MTGGNTSPRVCACLIVRNEARVIARCLDSVLPHVTHWAIVDTGSTDGTQDIVREMMADMPGELAEVEFRDFSSARNRALTMARDMGADYALCIDADEVLEADDGATLPELTEAAYAIPLEMEDQRWYRLTLIRLDLPWRYVGRIHEVVACPGQDGPHRIVEGFRLRNHADGHSSEDDKAKCARYAELLRAEIADDPHNPRHWYYLAQALAGAQQYDAALHAFARRVQMEGGFDEEVFHSHYETARLLEFLGRDDAEVIAAYERAYEARPTRAEPCWAIAVLHANAGRHALAEVWARAACRLRRPTDSLPVYGSVYHYRAAEELCGALTNLGRIDEALRIYAPLATHPSIPAEHRQRMADNLAYMRGLAAQNDAARAAA